MRQTAVTILRRLPLGLVLLLAACGSLAPSRPVDADPVLVVQPDAPADAVLLTIGDAIDNPGHALFVGGQLLIDADGTAWLCEALAESFPPQCGGDRLRVENIEAATLPKLATGGSARWSEAPVQLLGSVLVP